MKESTVKYVCSSCGHEESKWMGRCPECGEWNSFAEEKTAPVKNQKESRSIMDNSLRRLSDVPFDKAMRVSSRMDEFDRVLGNGVMRPSAVLIGGEPGIGKSTLMLQILSNLSEYGDVLYVSGEESPSQVRMRAERLKLPAEKISIFCDTRLEALSELLEREKPSYIVVDSIQTLYSASVASLAGSPNQIKTCCMELALLAKKIGSAVFFVGHITKEGVIAGPKIIEHLVDTVLYFETAETGMRLLRASKNRFGSVDEIGVFRMAENGLFGVNDPSQMFLSSRNSSELPAGISFTPIIEGSRTFVVEIQALVVPAKSGYQRIYSDRIDSSRVNRIAAILERHAGLNLSDQDIYVNVAGGMRLSEGSIDLAVALALYSSRANTPLPVSVASFGELSLAGEIRPVSFTEKRLKALLEMGFTRCVADISAASSRSALEVCKASNIKSGIIGAFRKS